MHIWLSYVIAVIYKYAYLQLWLPSFSALRSWKKTRTFAASTRGMEQIFLWVRDTSFYLLNSPIAFHRPFLGNGVTSLSAIHFLTRIILVTAVNKQLKINSKRVFQLFIQSLSHSSSSINRQRHRQRELHCIQSVLTLCQPRTGSVNFKTSSIFREGSCLFQNFTPLLCHLNFLLRITDTNMPILLDILRFLKCISHRRYFGNASIPPSLYYGITCPCVF